MEWLQATVTTNTEFADIVSLILFDLKSDGVSIVDKNDIKDVINSDKSWDYCDDSLLQFEDERVFVSGFFEKSFSSSELYEKLEELKANSLNACGSLEVEISEIKSQDWENEWKKYYLPIVIKNVVIVPKWIKRENDGKTDVLIDPGMAFGTGKHETTAMCIDIMQDIDLCGKTVADVGCGSGILGITALKLGAKRCIMSDIDIQAVSAAVENAKLNGVTERAVIKEGNLGEVIQEKVDVVIANITADILLRLKKELSEILKVGGQLIISGIINMRADEVLGGFQDGLRLISRNRSGEWQAMRFEAL